MNIYVLDDKIDSIALMYIETSDTDLLPDKASVLKFKAMLDFVKNKKSDNKVNKLNLNRICLFAIF